jgi:hypothetical protein
MIIPSGSPLTSTSWSHSAPPTGPPDERDPGHVGQSQGPVPSLLKAADPVYRLLGAGGLEARSMPEPNRLIDSTLGYHIRSGKHSMGKEDWKVFWTYADKHMGRANTAKSEGK